MVSKMKIFHIRYTYQKDFFEAMRLALFLMVKSEGSGAESKNFFSKGRNIVIEEFPEILEHG